MGGSTTISSSETRIEALNIQSSAYGVTVPLVYGSNRIAGNMVWYGDFKATPHTTSTSSGGKGGGGVTQNNTTYTYSASTLMALCEGPITAVPQIWKDKQLFADIPAGAAAITQLGMSLASGTDGQATWAYLTTFTPAGGLVGAQALGYSGLAYVYAQDYQLGNGASVVNHSFEIQGKLFGGVAGRLDSNTALAATDVLTNTRYGASFPAGRLVATDWSNYVLASGLLTSVALTEQMQAGEFIDKVCALTNTGAVWSGGALKMIPYGDTAITGNGATYSPNVTPLFDLTDDDYTPSSGGDPVRINRKPQADAFNHIRIEFVNRANSYNIEISEAKDSANIDAYGLRSADVLAAHWICDAAVARTMAQLLLQRAMYIRNSYEFTLPWTRALLEPMDLVTLTDSGLGLNKLAVRVIEVGESDSGDLSIVAEDFPVGVAHAALYTSQAGTGFQHNYNAAPGGILAPMFFEAPVERTLTGLEVYSAVRGVSAMWGGCRVWVSYDGVQYKDSGMIYGGARYGRLNGPIDGDSLPVVLNAGQMISGSATDSANLATLCYIGGANPEYLAHATATLTGPLSYTLSGLTRSAFTTSNANHSSGNAFVRVDNAIAKSGPLDLALIGKTIYFKYTSFNIYQSAEESLANVVAYPYTITGAMVKLAPAALTSFAATTEGFGIRLAASRSLEPDVVRYEYRVGATWATATVLESFGGTNYLWAVQTAGSFTFWVAPVDAFGNYGPAISTSAGIAGGTVSSLTSTIAGVNLTLQWAGTPGSFAISGYEVRYGAAWVGGTVIDFRQTTSYTEAVKWGGSRLYWLAAVDVKGNYGTPSSLTVTITNPGVVTGTRSDVIDNNALLYWTAPAIGAGQLAIDRYEVRKGASWAAGTVIGSNGNSTFTTVFEQSAGTYTYWVSAVDTAGNYGTAAGITAAISQPPDYVFRNAYDSPMTGTWVNFYASSASIWAGPVNTSETWATHFSGRAWATPADQIAAGFPVYADPSLTSGSYEEIVSYATDVQPAIPTTFVTATLNSVVVTGAVTVVCTLSWRLLSTDAWTVLPAASNALVPAFRQVRVHYDFACTAGANLLQINGLNVKLAMKLRNDSGVGTAAVGGTVVAFSYPFIAADTPMVQPGGATPRIPVVNYVGGASPTGFTVQIFSTAGVDVGGTFSWTARGY